MEIFVDFGLFEVIAGIGIAALARALYAHKGIGIGVLVASIGAPVTLVFLAPEGMVRWIAVLSLGTALMNAAVVLGAMRAGGVPRLLENLRRSAARSNPSGHTFHEE